jgi:50S ribosomal subunit-associated GTPase HflX
MSKLTSKTLKSVLSKDFIFHVVDTSDTTDNAAGSSFKATLESIMNLTELTKASFATNLIAHAGGGQPNALQLTKRRNRIDFCASNNDSVKFLQVYEGLEQEVYNNTTKDVMVFPFSGDKFLGKAIDEGIVLTTGSILKIFGYETLTLTY